MSARVPPRAAFASLVALAACHGTPSSDPPDQPASPQAKAEPAPIATPPTTSPSATLPVASSSAGTAFLAAPSPMRPDEPPPPDARPLEKEAKDTKETTREGAKDAVPVYTLTLAIRASDGGSPPKGVELSASGLEAARRKSEPLFAIDLTPGHARAVLEQGFVLADGTELRMRADRYGYVVVAADGESYRVAATGSLRAVLGEGLFEVAPSSAAEVSGHGEGARRLGRATRRVEVTTRAAKGSFELARMPELGDGGALVCRMLLDLMSAGPATPVCTDGDVPLHVELRWSGQQPQVTAAKGRVSGVSVVEAVSLVRRTDAVATSFLAPPPSAKFVLTGEPVHGSHLFLARADLAALRIAGEAPAGGRAGEAPAAMLSLHNSTDELRYVWLDGVPLAWLAPGGRLDVSGVPHAKATVQWRTFLGDAVDPAQVVTLPGLAPASGGPPTTVGAESAPLTNGDSPPP
jgi:hypothetical protein